MTFEIIITVESQEEVDAINHVLIEAEEDGDLDFSFNTTVVSRD